MKTPEEIANQLVDSVLNSPRKSHRRLIAIAGPPASGKSTIADTLCQSMNNKGCRTKVVSMDGFHIDNTVLSKLNLLNRKGAPETFDVAGFLQLVKALANEEQVYYPTFDRARDISIGGSGIVESVCDTVLIEGNYLLFDAPIWRDIALHWDFSIWLNINSSELEQRLIDRWINHGLSPRAAKDRAQENDMKNVSTVINNSITSNLVIDLC